MVNHKSKYQKHFVNGWSIIYQNVVSLKEASQGLRIKLHMYMCTT
jgi:hypothetical protein